MSASITTHARRGRILALIVSAAVMVPAAVAFACNPQANISIDRTTVEPGATITVYGSYFQSGRAITVSSPAGSTTVTSSAGGGFTASVQAPSSPGTYVISATKPTGGSAPATFRVAAPAAAPAPAPASSAPAPTAQQPAASQAPAQSTPSSRSFDEPTVSRSERGRAQTQPARSTAQPSTTQRSTSTPSRSRQAATPSTSTGQPAFSPAPAAVAAPTFGAAPAPTAAAPSLPASRREPARETGRSTSPAPTASDLTATGDVWSGFAPGRTASLTAGADGMSDGGAGNALTIGIGLLAFGLLAIVGGFAVAEAQRRRVPAR